MVILTALALVLVWQGAGLRATGYEVEKLQERIADQKALTAMYETHLSKLKNPQRVTTLVGWLGLDLKQPVPEAEPQETLIAHDAAPAAGAHAPAAGGAVSVASAPGF
jgi:hypothetical protein